MKAVATSVIAMLLATAILYSEEQKPTFTVSIDVSQVTENGFVGYRQRWITSTGKFEDGEIPPKNNPFMVVGHPNLKGISEGDEIGAVLVRDGVYKDGTRSIRQYRWIADYKD